MRHNERLQVGGEEAAAPTAPRRLKTVVVNFAKRI